MASPSVARLAEDSMRYIRWPTGSSSYSVEVNPHVVSGVMTQIATSAKLGVETGGVLLGSVDLSTRPVLRVERFELVPLRPEDGPLYLPSPQQQEHFATVAQHFGSAGLTPIGFFRSHLRSGPLALSLADQGFLWKQFKSDVHLVLLVDAQEPDHARLSIWKDGQIAAQEPVGGLVQREEQPKVPAQPLRREPPVVASPLRSLEVKQKQRFSPEWLVLLAVVCFAFGIVLWPLWEATFGGPWAIPSPGDIALSIQENGRDLAITWDKQMPEISRVDGATLTILDGAHRSEVQLRKDDLKFGSVTYLHSTNKVEANLILRMGDSTSLVQSTTWQGQ